MDNREMEKGESLRGMLKAEQGKYSVRLCTVWKLKSFNS